MLKFRTESSRTGRPMIGLGLSFRNLALLQQECPIHVDGRELGIDFDVLIFAGETEGSMQAELAKHVTLPTAQQGRDDYVT